ncbi:hypothetical protein D3C78_909230 [compost metagenome]
MRRTEEVQAQHLLRTLCHGGNGVDVQRRGVAGENRFWLEQAIELTENVLLELEVFVDRLDHQIDVADRRIVERRGHPSDTRIGFGLINAALTDVVGPGVGDGRKGLVEHLRVVVDPLHRHPGVGQAHDDATAHGACADHGGTLNLEGRLAHCLLSCWRSKDSIHHSQPDSVFEVYSRDGRHSADGCSLPAPVSITPTRSKGMQPVTLRVSLASGIEPSPAPRHRDNSPAPQTRESRGP